MHVGNRGWGAAGLLALVLAVGAVCLADGRVGIAPSQLSSNESLQAVIDRGGPLVYIPKGTYSLEKTLLLRSDLVLHFEPGTVIEAAPGSMKGKEDCLIAGMGVQNVSMYANGAT